MTEERPEYLAEFDQPPMPLSSRSTKGFKHSSEFGDSPEYPMHQNFEGYQQLRQVENQGYPQRSDRKCLWLIVFLLVLIIVFATIVLILWQRGVLSQDKKKEKLMAQPPDYNRLFKLCKGTPSMEPEPTFKYFVVPSSFKSPFTEKRGEEACKERCMLYQPTCLSVMWVPKDSKCYVETGFEGGDKCDTLPYEPRNGTHKYLPECREPGGCKFFVKHCQCKSGSGTLNMRKDIYHGMCLKDEDYSFDC